MWVSLQLRARVSLSAALVITSKSLTRQQIWLPPDVSGYPSRETWHRPVYNICEGRGGVSIVAVPTCFDQVSNYSRTYRCVNVDDLCDGLIRWGDDFVQSHQGSLRSKWQRWMRL